MEKPSPTATTLAGILSRFTAIFLSFVFLGLILFLAAGSLTWLWAWVYLAIGVVCVSINGTILLRTNPETVAERGRPKEVRDWDKVVSAGWALFYYIVIPLVAGLDYRFGWTASLGIGWNIAGAIVYTGGLALFSWAMIVNSFFSTAARIQDDRGQTVCQAGPYRFLRHPGYTDILLQSIGTPILLGSLWALMPGIATIGFMLARTVLEDRMLRKELTGYAEYTGRVRYRLLPGIW